MRIFARVEEVIVAELFPQQIFQPIWFPRMDGDIRTMLHPDVAWVEVTDVEPLPEPGWIQDGDEFAPPVPVPPSKEQTIATNELARDTMLDAATRAINPLQDSVDLKEATCPLMMPLRCRRC